MAISVKEAAVYFAMAESVELGREINVAIRFEDNGKIIAIGVDDAQQRNSPRSAIINVLQNSTRGRRNPSYIATSFPADRDEKSLGMCMIEDVRAVYFPNPVNAAIQVIEFLPAGNNPPWGVSPFQQIEGDLMVNFDAPVNEAPAAWLATIRSGLPQSPIVQSLEPAHNASRMYEAFSEKRGQSAFRSFTNFPHFTLPNDLPVPGARVDNPLRHEIFNKLAWAIVGEAAPQRGRSAASPYPEGHNIGSVLRGAEDQILAWGINTNKQHNTLHGEVNLMLNFSRNTASEEVFENGLRDTIIYSTLEPCHMCAGIIATAGNGMRCYYSQSDEAIQHNALERGISNSTQGVIEQIPGIGAKANPTGKLLSGVYTSQNRAQRRNNNPRRVNLTRILNNEYDKFILFAIQDYFDLFSRLGANERIIWEAGLLLLHHINPGVRVKWEKSKPDGVANILP